MFLSFLCFFYLRFQPDFFERHHLVCDPVFGFVDHAVRPFADLLDLLELLHRGAGGHSGTQ